MLYLKIKNNSLFLINKNRGGSVCWKVLDSNSIMYENLLILIEIKKYLRSE